MIKVITYDKAHRKTQDLLIHLFLKSYQIEVLVLPWQIRNNHEPLIPHRAFNPYDISLESMCKRYKFDLNYVHVNLAKYFQSSDLVLIGGSGILSQSVTSQVTIINSHPGYLPYVRGLDALKWAIYLDYPIGVTTHIINEKADAGKLIRQEMCSIFYWDTFHSLAQRQYELEIKLLVDSIEDIKTSKLNEIDVRNYEVQKRMPARYEIKLLKKFKNIKKNYEN